MKKTPDQSNDSLLYQQLRQQIGLLPMIQSFPATTAEQPDSYRAAYSLQTALLHGEKGNSPVLNPAGDESSLLQTVKGMVRSLVFLNWKDHA